MQELFIAETYMKEKWYMKYCSRIRSRFPGISIPFRINIHENIFCCSRVMYRFSEAIFNGEIM
jgi:hypothetical protein